MNSNRKIAPMANVDDAKARSKYQSGKKKRGSNAANQDTFDGNPHYSAVNPGYMTASKATANHTKNDSYYEESQSVS